MEQIPVNGSQKSFSSQYSQLAQSAIQHTVELRALIVLYDVAQPNCRVIRSRNAATVAAFLSGIGSATAHWQMICQISQMICYFWALTGFGPMRSMSTRSHTSVTCIKCSVLRFALFDRLFRWHSALWASGKASNIIKCVWPIKPFRYFMESFRYQNALRLIQHSARYWHRTCPFHHFVCVVLASPIQSSTRSRLKRQSFALPSQNTLSGFIKIFWILSEVKYFCYQLKNFK